MLEFPDPLLLAWLIPATSKRDVAAGFFVIARWAAAVMAALLPVEAPLLLLAWFIPAARKRDAAAGFFVIARWAAAVMADPEVGSEAAPASPPMRERRSGLDVKYLQERARASIGDAAHIGSSSVYRRVIGGVLYVEQLTHQGGQRKRLSRVWGDWQMAYA